MNPRVPTSSDFSRGFLWVLQEPATSSSSKWYRECQTPDWYHRTWEGWHSRDVVKYARRDHTDPSPAPPTYGVHRPVGTDCSEQSIARPLHYTWHTHGHSQLIDHTSFSKSQIESLGLIAYVVSMGFGIVLGTDAMRGCSVTVI
jgi:hypothetical protein